MLCLYFVYHSSAVQYVFVGMIEKFSDVLLFFIHPIIKYLEVTDFFSMSHFS